MIEGKYRYFAFISYKREDEEWAKWLQHKLEHYKLPSNLNGRTDLPKEVRPVFKDTSELMPGNLPDQIYQALDLSKYLIVICSPRSARSEWVNKEVETFFSMGRTTHVIPFIIDGKAFAGNPDEECFPLALRQLPEEQEILGANINEMGRDAAAVKVVARMFNIRFDELWQRHEREQRRRRRIIALAVTAFMISVLSVAGWIWQQNKELKWKNYQVMVGQSRYVAATASRLVDNGETYLARLLALEVLQNNPYTLEAEAALRKACQGNSTILSDDISATMALYSPHGKWVAAIVSDSLYVWDSSCGKLMLMIPTQQENVADLAFSASEDIVQTIDDDGNVKQWTIPDGTLCKKNVPVVLRNFQIPDVFGPQARFADPLAMSAAYSPDSSKIAVAYRSGRTRLWDIATHECIQTFDHEDLAVWGVDFCPDGKRILIVADRALRICDIAEPLLDVSTEVFECPIWKLVFSSNDKLLLSVYGTGMVCCWNVDDMQLLWKCDDDIYDFPLTIEFVNGDAEIQMVYSDGHHIKRSAADGSMLSSSKGTASDNDEEELGNLEALSPDGKTKAVVEDDMNVVIYKADSNEKICLLHKNDKKDSHAEVVSIAYSHDSRHIAVGAWNGDLKIYEFPPLQELIDSNKDRFKKRQLTSEERQRYYLD